MAIISYDLKVDDASDSRVTVEAVEKSGHESIDEPLRFSEKLGYGLGDTASNLYFQFFNLFLFYYYTDVFGLNPLSIGTMYLIANFWDAVNDPLMGVIADRVQTKQGKYRPFILWFSLPYGVFGFLIFSNPTGLNEVGKLLFAYSTFIAFKMVYTAVNVPYSALLGVMTANAEERVKLSTYRFLGAFGGGFLVSLLVRPLVRVFGGDNEVVGFQYTMAIFGVVSVLMFLATYVLTKERLSPQREKVAIGTDIKILMKNRPWLVMLVAAICTLASTAVRTSVTVHYFKYYMSESELPLITLGNSSTPYSLVFDETTIFLSVGMLSFIVGVAMTGVFSRLLGKLRALQVLTILNAFAIAAAYWVPPTQHAALFACQILAAFFAGPTPALVWALYTDVADYGEWRFNRRATGLVLSAAMFAQKMGLTIGGAASGWMLSAFSFVPNEEQNADAILGLRLMYAIIPGALSLLSGIVLLLYPLSQVQTEKMQVELQARRRRAQISTEAATSEGRSHG